MPTAAPAKPCTRFNQQGEPCGNTTTNANGWCGKCYGAKKPKGAAKAATTAKAAADAEKLADGAKETQKERVNRLLGDVERAVGDLTTSEGWQNYLETCSKFHHYSFNNQILIALQRPGATRVTGFGNKAGTTGWKSMGRTVNQGEKAIWILAPMTVTKKETDAATGAEEKRQVLVGWKSVPVFDVSQTSGDPLPDPETVPDGEAPPHLDEDLRGLLGDQGYNVVESAAVPPGTNAVVRHDDGVVALAEGLDERERVIALAGAAAHVTLRDPDGDDPGGVVFHVGPDTNTAPGYVSASHVRRGVEAEAVASVVSLSRGMGSDQTVAARLAKITGGDTDTIKKSAGRIRGAAKVILDRLDKTAAQRAGADKEAAA